MRRIFTLLLCIVMIFCLCICANAAQEASQINVQAVVSSDGTSQVTASATIHMDQGVEKLQFPVPADATDISLNGGRARTHTSGSVKYIDLSAMTGSLAGDFSFSVSYNLPNRVVKNKSDLLELQLPILSGFAFSTKALSFTITLPGEISTQPGFSSGYHQSGIEQDLSVSTEGAMITGQTTKDLKDHETLMMILPVTEEMFPQIVQQAPSGSLFGMLGGLFALAALVYWLIFLRHRPQWSARRALPPEGCTAGEIRSILYLQGADLTGMVFSWAQLGYVTIQPDRRGRVYLHKQMDMGNERSSFERRAFSGLFGKRQMVDATGSHYAELAAKVSKSIPNVQDYVENRSGNLKVFRVLCAGIGLACGAGLGYMLCFATSLQWVAAAILGVLGGWAVYTVMPWAAALFQPERRPLWKALITTVIWILLGMLAGSFLLALAGVLAGILGGILLAMAGRRTDTGHQVIAAIIGLRRYMTGVSRHELQSRCEENPAYFFELAPFALAMGADRSFAKRFGDVRLPPCPYIHTELSSSKTALQWSEEMRKIAGTMNARSGSPSLSHDRRSRPQPKRRPNRR